MLHGKVVDAAAGGVIGQNMAGTVRNCSNVANVTDESSVPEKSIYARPGGVAGASSVSNNQQPTIENCSNSGTITSKRGVCGGIVGTNEGPVRNSINTGTVIGGDEPNNDQAYLGTGGIVGINKGGNIDSCRNEGSGNVSGTGRFIGGIAGQNQKISDTSIGTITNCYNKQKVTSTKSAVGGVVGLNSGKVEKSYNLGEIRGEATATGGIAGNNQGTAKNCYNGARVIGNSNTGNGNTGGVAGILQTNTSQFLTEDLKLECCYNYGEISGNTSGQIIGSMAWVKSYSVKNNYYSTAMSLGGIGYKETNHTVDIIGKTTSELKGLTATLNSLNGGNTIWKVDSGSFKNNGYPILIWQ